MRWLEDLDQLHALYGAANPLSISKVARGFTPLYKRWIDASRFCIIATVGPEGTDASPRGDDGPVGRIVAADMMLIPDWRGNNRLDTLRNIVSDGRISVTFMCAGSNNVVRVNGTARITDDTDLCNTFAKSGKAPTTVIAVSPNEVYFQCGRALLRSGIWGRNDGIDLPTAGDFINESVGEWDQYQSYDSEWEKRAKDTLW